MGSEMCIRDRLGTFMAIILLGALTTYGTLPLLIAPLGASCALLFAAPASPLSQPINVIGGHVVSAISGVLCAMIMPASFVVAAIAVATSLMAMMVLRLMHPPAGATALIGYASAAGLMFVIFPVLAGSVVLVGLAYFYHALTKTQFPLHPPK